MARDDLPLSLLRVLVDSITPNLDREYPHRTIYDGRRDEDWVPPRRRHPVFFGSYDWHSSVHSHWALARLARAIASADDESREAAARAALAERCRGILRERLTRAAIDAELAFFAERPGFELPYGLSWAALLAGELAVAAVEDPRWTAAAEAVAPLGALALDRLAAWVAKLPTAIRSGEHSQSASAMVLAHEAARALGRRDVADALVDHGRRLHRADRAFALHLEPSAWDFMSPSLAAAWLMSRCLPAAELARWLERAAPSLGFQPLSFAPSADRDDGKLAHWDGLLWSRAWMMRAVGLALPPGDPRRDGLERDAEAHAAAALVELERASYAGLHWLATFAAVWHTGGVEISLARPAAERSS
ncbi:MAG: DUF2891 family protein [Kofleriaceae bacterium]